MPEVGTGVPWCSAPAAKPLLRVMPPKAVALIALTTACWVIAWLLSPLVGPGHITLGVIWMGFLLFGAAALVILVQYLLTPQGTRDAPVAIPSVSRAALLNWASVVVAGVVLYFVVGRDALRIGCIVVVVVYGIIGIGRYGLRSFLGRPQQTVVGQLSLLAFGAAIAYLLFTQYAP